MPGYRIIADDQKESGPVSADQIRQWMTEGRVDDQTKVQAEGSGEWKRLADVPEFADGLSGIIPSICPACGESIGEGFDSCWKCGTGKDGSRPKDWAPLADASTKAAEPCPRCGSQNAIQGKLLPLEGGTSVMFRPEGTRFTFLRFLSGVVLSSDSSFACPDCGLVWDYLPPHDLKEFIATRCGGLGEPDPYALLTEAARLEALGDTAEALAKYKALLEKFPDTGAAKDAELSIRNLMEKMG